MRSLILVISFFLFSGFVFSANGNEPLITVDIQPVSCNGEADGSILIMLNNISGPHILKVIRHATKDTNHYSFTSDSELTLEDLPSGLIQLSLFKGQKAIASTNALIPEPEPLQGGKISVDRRPSDPSSCDGVLSVNPGGGNPPYTYKWSENAGSAEIEKVEDICMGIYRCEINDSKKCGPVYISIPLFENTLNSE
jgi:hypothetical protein